MSALEAGHRAVVSAVGADRPGIVASVAAALTEVGANLEDSAMTILRDQFAMMLVVALPRELSLAALEVAMSAVGRDQDLLVSVRELAGEDEGPARASAIEHRLSVYGADHPGIVSGIASLLARRGVNIVDLTTRVIGSPEHPVYAMLLDLAVPGDVATEDLAAQLHARAAELGVDCELSAVDADVL